MIKNIGIKLADGIAAFVGSWTFIIIQSIVLIIWVFVNLHHLVHFDPYPFILMNLFLSFQAAYATPMILMSSNRQATKDREQLINDLQIDIESLKKLDGIIEKLDLIEQELKEIKALSKVKKPKTKNVL